jgi:hypothetical protein
MDAQAMMSGILREAFAILAKMRQVTDGDLQELRQYFGSMMIGSYPIYDRAEREAVAGHVQAYNRLFRPEMSRPILHLV